MVAPGILPSHSCPKCEGMNGAPGDDPKQYDLCRSGLSARRT